MNWLLPACVASASGVAILAMTTWYLYHAHRQRFMLIWAVAWTVFLARYLFMIVGLLKGPGHATDIGYYVSAIGYALLMLSGSRVLLGRPQRWWFTALGAVVIAWGCIAVPLGLPDPWVHYPVFLFLGTTQIAIGALFLRGRPRGEVASSVVGWLFVLWGIHEYDYPFLRPVPWFAPWGYMLGGALAFSIAIWIIILYFERTRRELLSRELALNESQEQYSSIISTAPDGFCRLSRDGEVIDVNDAYCRMLGWSRSQLLHRRILDLEADETPEQVQAHLARLMVTSFDRFETRHRRADGSLVDVEISITALKDEAGFVAFVRDIAQRKQAEEALRQSEDRYRRLVEGSPDIVYVFSTLRGALFWSGRALEVLGYSPELLCSKPFIWYESVHPDDLQAANAAIESARQGRGYDLQYRIRTAGGEWRWLWDRAISVRRSGDELIVEGLATDITERRRADEARQQLEQQLLHAGKMEAVGRLAGGVAHDLNNLLVPILGYSEMILNDERRGVGVRHELMQVHRAAERARDLTRQLLAFSRKQMLDLRPIDLAHVIGEAFRMLRRTIREDIELRLDLADRVSTVRADAAQVEHALLNLVINAQDAIAGPGAITIALRDVTFGDAGADSDGAVPAGDYVRLSVSDTGCGIDADTQAQIFEPFFTTKEPGKGTGLGLAMVYGIVRQHEGHVRVESAPGRGATFSILLPRSGEPAAREEPGRQPSQLARGGRCILVVEDNEMVLALIRQILTDRGHRVVAAEHAQHCLEIFRAQGDDIDLVLTDVIMPGMTGRELYEQLRRQRPQLKVIYMSGYASDIIAEHGVLEPGTHFVQKPFSVTSLIGKIEEVLQLQPAGAVSGD